MLPDVVEQLLKAHFPIDDTVPLILRDFIEHLRKAKSPIVALLRLVAIKSKSELVKVSKADVPIDVALSMLRLPVTPLRS